MAREERQKSPPFYRLQVDFGSAWARVEDEATSPARRRQFEDMRQDWGRMARDFLELLDE